MNRIREFGIGLTRLFFPHNCLGCGAELAWEDQLICLHCMEMLPLTRFEKFADNPVERIFWGRANIHAATCLFYFTKDSILQHILHQFKYRGKKEVGEYFGRWLGQSLLGAQRFHPIDAMVPLPLHASRERKRGYNQAALLCESMAKLLQIPVYRQAVRRSSASGTQTTRSRLGRWANMEGRFEVADAQILQNKHILLVDDIVTTGATLDACANELLRTGGVRVSIAALAYTIL